METPIYDFLEAYAKSGAARLHMPGGKGLTSPHDITEISGADILYESSGIIRSSERNAARLFGAADTCYSCGGATLAIQAMTASAAEVTGKRTIAAGRYSHRSLVDTAILLGLDINWVYPREFLGADISPADAAEVIDSETAALFINSVDYLGGEPDMAALHEVCAEKGVLLLADNAHGAYKVFTGDHPIGLGTADMTADSAHKTLPALTGAAYLHLNGKVSAEAAKSAMALFGSSSPSYLMLESLDLCNRFIAENAERAMKTLDSVSKLKSELCSLGIVLRNSDAMRITVSANEMGYTGHELAELMRGRGIECEMSGQRYVVLLFSVVQPEEDFDRIREFFEKPEHRVPLSLPEIPVIRPEKVMTAREAYFSRRERVNVRESVGCICGGVYSPCPPCVPLVMPGERIDAEAARLLELYGSDSITVVR